MNGRISEPTIERMEEKLGRPIRRGLDKAMNEIMDQSDSQEKEIAAASTDSEIDCLNNNTKRCLTN